MKTLQILVIGEDIIISDTVGGLARVQMYNLTAYQFYNFSDILKTLRGKVDCSTLAKTLDSVIQLLNQRVNDQSMLLME
jgi:hypothetical protein